jgi:RNA polymerase sigma-70 factor (ECF subfamily)
VTDARVDLIGGLAPTPSSLLVRVRSPEDRRSWESAWRRLVDLYSPVVYAWCLGAGLQPADAADVGQEVFLTVARKLGQFRRDREADSFRGWLYAIARNKVRDWARHRGASGANGDEDLLEQLEAPQRGPSDPPVSDTQESRLFYRRALDLVQGEFEPRSWQAFWGVVVEGQPPADIAARLGMTANAVYLAKSRVLRRLREEFDGLVEF